MDKWRAVYFSYLDSSKAFNTLSHSILTLKFEKYGQDKYSELGVKPVGVPNMKDSDHWKQDTPQAVEMGGQEPHEVL